MAYTTKKEFEAWAGGWSWIEKLYRQFAEDYRAEFLDHRETIDEVEIEPGLGNSSDSMMNGTIEIRTETYYCGCCGPEPGYYSLPISYLWEEDWIEKEKEKRALAEQKRKEKAEKERIKKEEEMKEARYRRYLELKKEFED